MKKILLFTLLGLLLLSVAPAGAQRHRHTPVGVEAFSDTSSVPASKKANLVATNDSAVTDSADADLGYADEWDGLSDGEKWQQVLQNLDSDTVEDFLMVIVVAVLGILLLPLIFIALLIWFIVRNRRQSRRLQQEAERYEIDHCEAAPQEMANSDGEEPVDVGSEAPKPRRNLANDRLYTRGVRQIFLGIGLCILLYYMMGGFGFGIGALVTCMGVGDYWIARSQRKREENLVN